MNPIYRPRGAELPQTKLTPESVREIRAELAMARELRDELARRYSARVMAERHRVDIELVQCLARCREVPLATIEAIHDDLDRRAELSALRADFSLAKLARRHGVAPSTIAGVGRGRAWAHVPEAVA